MKLIKRVKAFIEFKGKFELTYIGRIGNNGVFKFRNEQLKKACFKKLKNTFNYDCLGGSMTIPDKYITGDKYYTCYNSVVPMNQNSKYIVTYWK